MDVAQQFERVRFGIRTLRKRNKHLLDAAEPLHYIINEERQKFGNQIRIDILFACHLLPRDGTRSQYTRRLVHMHPRQSGAKKLGRQSLLLEGALFEGGEVGGRIAAEAGPWRGGAVSSGLGFRAIWQDRRPRGPER